MKRRVSAFSVIAFGLALLGLLLVTTLAFGQTETGTISGTVHDASGAVISGAAVTVRSVTTGAERATQSGNIGQFSVGALPVGQYLVTIKNQNFQTFQSQVEVTVGGITNVNAQLTVGRSETVVEVNGGGAAQVNTETQEVSQLVNSNELMQLPSLNRNPYDFVITAGNVSAGDNSTNSMNSGQNLTSRGVGVSINGQRESGSEILLDGVENVAVFGVAVGQQTPVDSVQEYSVITNNFGSEYGRASGGVVNVTTKSGTNSFHGSAWDFNRLSAYTANTYNNDARNSAFLQGGGTGPLPAPKGSYTRNAFGFQVGGPIKKNKLFIFESTEWTRVRSSATQTEEILDPGFISTLPTNIQNYFGAFGTGAPAAAGVVTASQLAGAGNPLTVFATGQHTVTVPGTTPIFDIVNFQAPFDAGGDIPQNTYRLVGRLDFNLSDKTQMFFRGGRENENQFLGSTTYTPYSQYDVGAINVNQSYLYSLTHTFSPALLTNSKLSYTRFNDANSFNTKLTSTPNLMLVGFASDPATGNVIQLPGLQNTAPGLGGLPFGGPQNTIQFFQDVSWNKGRHSMRFGGQLTYIQLNVAYGAYAQAVEQLGGTLQQGMDSLVNAAGNPGGSPLVSFASRVNPQGAVPCRENPDGTLIETSACSITPPLNPAAYARSYRYHDWSFYAQDSFKITPRLTLNYGLRYEHYGVQHNNDPSLDSNFYFGSGATVDERVRNGNLFVADKSPVGQFWAPNWGTVAPRIGFAYDVLGDGKTSLRGGYGISYERNFGNVTFNASFNPPASAVVNAVCVPNADNTVGGPGNPCGVTATNNNEGVLGLPGPTTFLPPAELRMPAPNINTAQTQFWSFGLQRELARSTVFEAVYNGARGVHLYDVENINLLGDANIYLGDAVTNPACAASAPANPTLCLTRPNNQFSNINMRGSLGNSAYHALNLRLTTQNIHESGVSVVANYTWAHSLDDLSSTFGDSLQGGSGAIGSLGYTNYHDPMLDWGNSDYDIRHRFVLSPIWETPWMKSGSGFLEHAAGGWTLSGIFTARTGTPFSVYDYTNDANFYTVPRLTPATAVSYNVGSPQAVGPNLFNALSLPVPASAAPLNSTLGISDFGPYPAGMTRRNAFRGPGAWNADFAVAKNFKITERFALQFRAEGFDIFNHHNYYVNTSNLAYFGPNSTGAYTALNVNELKGGLNTIATGGNHDERRFGQFSLRLNF